MGVLLFLKMMFCFKISKVDVGVNLFISVEFLIFVWRNLNLYNCYNIEYYIMVIVIYINVCIENYLCREFNY